jgi:acetolactate decarboxylase
MTTRVGRLYVVSPINAILEGLYETSTTLAQLAGHGDFGIGTFNDLDGELLRVDGVTYRLDAAGDASVPDAATGTPFAVVCTFAPYATETVGHLPDHAAFEHHLDRSLLSPNMMFAIRMDGHFKRVRTRSVPRTANHTALVDATRVQTLVDMADVDGTLVGFYTPPFMPSVNVPGYHFHFITADRRRGGHLIDCEIGSATVAYQICAEMLLNLPVTIDYLSVEFRRDARADIEQAER